MSKNKIKIEKYTDFIGNKQEKTLLIFNVLFIVLLTIEIILSRLPRILFTNYIFWILIISNMALFLGVMFSVSKIKKPKIKLLKKEIVGEYTPEYIITLILCMEYLLLEFSIFISIVGCLFGVDIYASLSCFALSFSMTLLSLKTTLVIKNEYIRYHKNIKTQEEYVREMLLELYDTLLTLFAVIMFIILLVLSIVLSIKNLDNESAKGVFNQLHYVFVTFVSVQAIFWIILRTQKMAGDIRKIKYNFIDFKKKTK